MNEALRTLLRFRWAVLGAIAFLGALLCLRVFLPLNSAPHTSAPIAAAPEAIVPSVAPAHAPAAKVPRPKPLTLEQVSAPPRWNLEFSEGSRPATIKLDFSIDLDYFAPLGDGPANTAIWFRDFAPGDGSRAAEIKESNRTEVTLLGLKAEVYPASDPLLREAEPWVDQATCRFYPDVWKPKGPATPTPNLLFAFDLARSWTYEGVTQPDAERAKENCRRVIRLGRLLMQDDVTLIQRYAAWACIAMGLRGLNERARREGDAVMVAATTLALGDYNAMRGIATQWQRDLRFERPPATTCWGLTRRGSFSNAYVGDLIEHARRNSLRCMRAEAILPLVMVRRRGSIQQRKLADAVLSEIAHGKDPVLTAELEYAESL